MEKVFSRAKRFIVLLLTALLVGGGLAAGSFTTIAHAVNVGANPTPKVDIAVSLPSDYPGTFLEFKQELTQKLIDQGMAPGSFRITDTAAKIDTSNTQDWLQYNHNTGSVNIASYFNESEGKLTNTSCLGFSSHIYNFTKDDKTSMVFAGYPNISAFDAMIYPAPSNARRTFSFDVNGSAVKTHTLNSTGFMMNVGRNADGTLTGYYLRLTGSSDKITNAAIFQVSNFNPTNNSIIGGTCVNNATQATNLGSVNKARFTVELRETSVTVQKQDYDSAGNLGDVVTLFGGAVPLVANGYNGFGPYMQNSSHNCSVFTQFSFLDLEMRYDSSAFDALKTTQYYESAEQKYFINLAGDSADPQIPDEGDETYADGINRMNENEIFYLSNAQDGKIVTDSVKDENGNITHQGLGSSNGYIAMSDDYVTEMAEYIYNSFVEGKRFSQAPISSDIPLANFYMVNTATGEQLMTVHQRHLFNNDQTVSVNFFDKSIIGQLAGPDGKISQWNFKVYDPNNAVKYSSGWKTDPSQIPDFTFDKNSAQGKWIFELQVKDQNGNESKASQTYIVVFLDEEHPYIEGANSGRNEATITLTDTGQGIDDDGITFIEDGRGSGVAAYWYTNDPNAVPTEDDWEYLDEPTHQHSFKFDIVDTDPIVVWVKDECGNIGNKAVFQPTRVVVQDPDGNPIDDYIVIEKNPIIILPDEDGLDDPEDPEEKFAGWTTPGGDPITPGTTVPSGNDHTIVIRPSYAKDYANVIYLANGGTIAEGSTAAYEQFQVVSGNSLKQKIQDHNIVPVREGYSFDGWKLIKGDTNAVVDALVNKAAGTSSASAGQLVDPDDQVAKLVLKDPEGNPRDEANVIKSNYYLVAQWKIGDYTVRLDANGGSLGATRSFEGVKYQTNVGTLAFPVQGRTIPSKPGYIFQGWSTTKNAMDDTSNTFKVASGVTGIAAVAAPTMPAHDITVYAVWKEDKNQFVVHFDSAGGSRVTDQAYKSATTSNYTTFKTPTRPGYDFAGWYPVAADGAVGETAYDGSEAVIVKAEHTFQAKWTPRDDTKYTVDYYVNSGNKDANGNHVYTKVNDASVTKTYAGTTESTVSVAEADKTPEIAAGGKDYWYNPGSSRVVVGADGTASTLNNNVLSGQVTGSPTLSLKLYYDRFFDVTAIKDRTSTGDGTCTSALKQKEGTKPTVTWRAADGSHVESVKVNGIVRDDLLAAGSYMLESPLEGNVGVVVKFAKDSSSQGGSGKPVPPKPPVTENTHFAIQAIVLGASDPADVTITPTQSVKNGNDAQVVWSLPENSRYTISEVTVDGAALSPEEIAEGKVDFTKVGQDHKVVVTVKALPTLGGMDTSPDPVNPIDPDDPVDPDGPKQTSDKYTLTVNRYGGDSNVIVAPSATVNAGEKAVPSWDATGSDDWQIVKIVVDGKDITSTLTERQLQSMTYRKGAFASGYDANHVVDIYLAETPKATEPGDGTPTPDPVIPDYTDPEQFVKITTKIVGTEGNINGHITGGAVVSKDSSKEFGVDWSLKATAGDNDGALNKIGDLEQGDDGYFYAPTGTSDDEYVCYELVKVLVNGVEQPKSTTDGKVTVLQDSDKVVEIQVRPVLHTVTIVKYGEGIVSPSKSVYHLGNYRDIVAQESGASKLVKIVVDGEEVFTAEGIAFDTEAGQASEAESVNALSAELAAVIAEDEQGASNDDSAEAAHEPTTTGVTNEDDGAQEAEPNADVAEVPSELDDAKAPEATVEDAVVKDEPVQALAVTEGDDVVVEPKTLLLGMLVPAEQVAPATADAEEVVVNGKWTNDQEKVKQDHLIQVYFAKQATDENGDPKTDPDGKPVYEPIPETLHSVSATIKSGEGTVEGNSLVAEGSDASLKVIPGDGYEVAKVTDKDGNDVTSRLVKNEDGSYSIDVTNVKNDESYLVELKRTPVPNSNDPVPGDIDPVVTHEITASLQGGTGSINGAGFVKDGSDRTITWQAANPEEKVAYVFIDGVNHPELCTLDSEGKGSYTFEDVKANHHIAVVFATNTNNVDKDGDGEPDINIDTDGDGKPDLNVDTDGDGKPDVNIVDEDGDGKPDPVDPKKPAPKPVVNIDTDGDGKPDLNIDTDGDGKPDLNIVDKDKDGKPDPVDPKQRPVPTPDVNVDVDGDGIPDLNIDTDGDGIPDKNIDADGDGVIDTVVDEEGNGQDKNPSGDDEKPEGGNPSPAPQPGDTGADPDDQPGEGGGLASTNGSDDGLGKAKGESAVAGLAKTGDVAPTVFGATGAVALVAAIALLATRNRRARDEQ